MIAHLQTAASRRAACAAPTLRRTRRNTRTACTQVHRLLQRQQKRARASLAIESAVNGAVPKATAPSTKLHLPRTLPRPTVGEVNTSAIEAAYPELAGVAPEYIRERLPTAGAHMLAAISSVQACPPKSSLPKELEIIMNDAVAAACPTHVLAVYSSTPAPPSQKRKVTLFPAHDLLLAAHCANLPALPASKLSTSSCATATLPVVPLCLPSAEAFPFLQAYLYTKSTASLFTSLLPSAAPVDTVSLAHRATLIHGLWRNACALGVVDSPLFDTIDRAWDAVVGSLQAGCP